MVMIEHGGRDVLLGGLRAVSGMEEDKGKADQEEKTA